MPAQAPKNVHATTPGFNSFDEMNEDLAVMEDIALTDAEKEYLKKTSTVTGLYCEGCGRCIEQCPQALPIPDVMRAYMCCFGYRSAWLSKGVIGSLDLPRDACQSCAECAVTCAQGFDIPAKVREIVRIRDVPSEFLV